MITRPVFYAHVRKAPAADTLTQGQIDGFGRILDEWERRALADLRWLAYMLATCWHETGAKMQPVREEGSEDYLRSKPYYPWVGEGLVQVTWRANAMKFGASKPGDCMTWPVALEALYDGMIKGMFTGHKLADFFGQHTNDPINARRIINGVDRASMIATYHASFLTALTAADVPVAAAVAAVEPPAPVLVKPFAPPHIGVVHPDAPAKGFWASLWSSLTGKTA